MYSLCFCASCRCSALRRSALLNVSCGMDAEDDDEPEMWRVSWFSICDAGRRVGMPFSRGWKALSGRIDA